MKLPEVLWLCILHVLISATAICNALNYFILASSAGLSAMSSSTFTDLSFHMTSEPSYSLLLNVMNWNIFVAISNICPVCVKSLLFSPFCPRGMAAQWKLTLLVKTILWNLQRTGNICTNVVSMDTCHVSASLCMGKQCRVSDLNQAKKVSKLSWLTSRQPGGVGWAEQGCWGLRVEDLDSCTRGVMERLGLPAKKRRRPLLKVEVPQGGVLMHDGWNKIK